MGLDLINSSIYLPGAQICLKPLLHINAFILTALNYHIFENIIENVAFALLEQMLLFP